MIIQDHLGNEYISRKEMCKKYGIREKDFCANLKSGLSLKECLTGKRHACPTKSKQKVVKHRQEVTDFQGNTFSSNNKMCEAYGIPAGLYNQRVRKYGWDKKRALLTPAQEKGRKIVINGKEYWLFWGNGG